MIPLDEALRRIVSAFSPLDAEAVPLAEALGRTLAAPIRAHRDQPPFDNSAMDGWAIRAAGDDTQRVVAGGESRAGGSLPAPLPPGQALRIFTGAPMPEGADTVVLQEDTERDEGRVRFTETPTAGQHVRRRASDFASGDTLLAAGLPLGPGAIALVASQGVAEVSVHRRPRVAIVPTGDELIPAGSDAPEGTLFDSNGPMLEALVRQAGALPFRRPAVGDDLEALAEAFREALTSADLLLTTGGVSVGDHDHVKEALGRANVALDLWKVAVKPGKPVTFGRTPAGGAVLGLPGNPVSAFVTFTLFARPAVRRMMGDPRPAPPRIRARLLGDLPHRPGRTELARGRVASQEDGWTVEPHPNQGSGSLVSLGAGNGLILVPASSTGLAAGDTVDVLLVDDLPGERLERPLDG